MLGMVGKVFPGQAMDEDGQPLPVDLQPRNQVIELRGIKRELATPLRVWSYWFLVEAPDLYTEQLAGTGTKHARCCQ
jgi:hypothetical protein